MEDVELWKTSLYPAIRFKSYLMNRGLWDEDKEEELGKKTDTDIKVFQQNIISFIFCFYRHLFKKPGKSRSLH